MELQTILLQQANEGSSWSGMLMIVAMIVIFYFFMIRPQQKRQKKIREERASMQKGDTVITAGGIYGKIREVKDTYFMVEIDTNVKVRVDKNMVYKAADDAAEASQQQQNK
ncbi:MAG: preprotein translocase subunit YajC [Muribaculaceae bacterium]|nr:preprotein translocase subunit YajC [Muribaculaceae bacterium]